MPARRALSDCKSCHRSTGFCLGAPYTIGVHGKSSVPSTFSVLYTLDEVPISLQHGVPTPVLASSSGEGTAVHRPPDQRKLTHTLSLLWQLFNLSTRWMCHPAFKSL